jgi:4-aminobutyrate aminotransferase
MQVAEKKRKLPHLITVVPGPKAKEIVARDHAVVSPSYTRDYPLVAKSGSGAIVRDADGNDFLDFAAGIAVVATGHCHPEVVAAIQRQASALIHMSCTDFYYEGMVELAEKLAAIAPGKDAKRVYFGNSGTEAIEAAMKLARYHTRRDNFIAFHGSFHGRTFGSLSLTASKVVQRKHFGSLLAGVFHTPYPDPYRGAYGGRPEHAATDALTYLENELFKRLVDPKDVAAIFIEPIQGEGGYVPAPVEFLQGLERLCHKHGILLVADEVQSGMGRTGTWWAVEHAGIEPDMICVAKGIASGMPLSAVIAKANVMDWKPGAHASTFGGNPVSVAASLATMGVLERGAIANANRIGEYIFRRTADWRERHKSVGDVRGKGLMIGIEFVRDQKTKERAPELRERVIQAAFGKGLLILGAGENSLRLAPPLIVDEEQAEFAVDTLDACISEAERAS